MKRTHRLTSPRAIRLLSLVLCYLLIGTTVFLPLSPTVSRAGAQGSSRGSVSSSSRSVQPAGFLGVPGRMLASLLTLFQGGGLPSVPGPNLPDLDAARQLQPAEPEALPPIVSSQPNPGICIDCEPGNNPPISRPGGPYFGSANQAIAFNGLGSSDVDPGDSISDYAWTFGDSPTIVHGATPSHIYQSAGNYTVSLTVTDQHDATKTASTTATVNAGPTSTPTPGASPTPAPSPEQTNAAVFVSQSVAGAMVAGQVYSVSVTMRNTGDTTWSAARLYRLGSQNPQDNNAWGRSRAYLPADVLPGAEVTFNFTVRPLGTNPSPAPVHFQWRMVQDGVGWFGDTHDDVVTVTTPPQVSESDPHPENLATARLEPANRTGEPGEDLVSGNFNWMLNVLNLSGRAGLNLNLPLSYNSLAAWTKVTGEGASMTFDADRGFPSVGFRLGFPSIRGPFYNNQTAKNAYLLNTPAGGHIELRRVDSSSVYESADSSYLQLFDGGNGTLLLRGTDGSQLAYLLINGEYRCTEVKDRNGNYITIKFEPLNGTANPGLITSIIDTLSRTISFKYDGNYRLQSLTQLRSGQPHSWATFGYTDKTVNTNFVSGEEGGGKGENEVVVLGLPANNTVSVLTQVSLDDGSRYNFEYTDWGQVHTITHHAADSTPGNPHPLSYVAYNLPPDDTEPQSDCPRFTQRQDWAENWNGNAPVSTSFQFDQEGHWGQVTADDGAIYKEFFTKGYSDWRRGLVSRTEVFAPGNTSVPAKTTVTDWTQDATNVAYPLNPRPTAITISDAEGKRRRTTIEYGAFGLPSEVYEQGPYGTNDWRTLRRTHTDYNLSDAYVNRRIIGLVAGQYLFAPDANGYSIQTLLSKTTMEYDVNAICSAFCYTFGPEAPVDPVVQHDYNYGGSFTVGRGLLAKVQRWDAFDEMNVNQVTTSSMVYNVYGSVIRSVDPSQHTTQIHYSDAFSNDGTGNNPVSQVTMAYPTLVKDADGYYTSAKYNYDLGAVTRQQDPKGAAQTTQYDSAGRVKRVTNAVNLAYTRFVYPSSQTIVNKFTTIKDLATEAYTATVYDGAGRVRAVAGDFPDAAGNHYSGQFTLFDSLGRAVQSTNPTEMTNAWAATGADNAGWHSSTQTYDWKGRALVTTNPDGTTKKASYDGCGCAGGEVVTLTDEGTLVDIDPGPEFNNVVKKRQQKIYSDVLGRTIRTEVLNWDGAGSDGTGGSVYATTVNAYDALDQVKSVRQYQGSESSGVYQETTMTYDGYGRPKTRHIPEQKADPNIPGSTDHTTWEYLPDEKVKVTDARGITTTFGYNARHLLTSVTYPAAQDLPAGVPATANVSYGYDAGGNRSSMSDSSGNIVSYDYDTLSRLESEARQFPGLAGTYTLAYEYSVAGQVKKVTDQSPGAGTSFSYTLDNIGRLESVSSTGLGATASLASNAKYRASGALKHREYGNGTAMNLAYNSRGLITQYSLTGVKETNGAARAEGSDFQYYADGRVKFASDFYGRASSSSSMSFHDKSYQYDQVGRLQVALSGVEANDFLNNTNSGPLHGAAPYLQSYTHDAWSNMVERTGLYWSENDEIGPQGYDAHNRNAAWSYDADGRLMSMNEPPFNEHPYVPAMHTYDAAGRHVKNTQTTSRVTAFPGNPVHTTITTIDSGYDGDGQQVKRVETTQLNSQPPTGGPGYYLRSSVLGGQVITEYDAQGGRVKSHVYGGGGLIASTSSGGLEWRYNNPVTGDGRETDVQGELVAAAYVDPQGVDVGASDPADNQGEPPPSEPLPNAGAYAAYLPRSLGGSGLCRLNGIQWGCGFLDNLRGTGMIMPVPELAFTTRTFVRKLYGVNLRLPANPFDEFVDSSIIDIDNAPIRGDWVTTSFFWGASAPSLPQDAVTQPLHWLDLAKIRTDVKTIAGRGRCQEFLTNLLERAGKTGGDEAAVHTDIVDLFDAVLLQQGFATQKTVNGRGFSSVRGAVGAPGGAQVLLSNGSNDFKGKLRIQYFAYDALSELTHVAGSKASTYATGAFSDYHLAKTALDVANEMGTGIQNLKLTLPTVDPKNDPSGQWSDFYHNIVKLYCKRQERF